MRAAICLAAVALQAAAWPAAAQPAPAACTLFSGDDAAAALGEPAKAPRSTVMSNGPSSCEYEGSGLHSVQVTVIPMPGDQAAFYKGLCAKKDHGGLTGLGEVTCWYNDRHDELQVLKGQVFYSVKLHRSGDPTEPIKAAARKIYDRVK